MSDAVQLVRVVGARSGVVIGAIVIVTRSERVADAGVLVRFLRCVGAGCGRLIGLLSGATMAKRVRGFVVEFGSLRFVGARSWIDTRVRIFCMCLYVGFTTNDKIILI